MTDRLKGLIVIFEQDIREDDSEEIINAIKMFRGVASVGKNVTNFDDFINRTLIKKELFEKITKIFMDGKYGE